MQKKHLEVFYKLLNGTDGVLNLKEARVRDSMMKQVITILTQFYEDRKKIFETFCTKDEAGKPVIEGDRYTFPNENIDQANKEYQTLLDEESNLTLIAGLKEILEKTTYTPKYGEMELVDEILAKL